MAVTGIKANFWRDRSYLAVIITHFFVDVLNSSRNLVVAILAVEIGLTNAQVGIALLLYNVGSALAQPLFGWLADRIGPRWLVVGGMGWMIFFFGVTAVSGNWLALIAITVAGVGSGAFHPTGTMVASQISQTHRNRATAVFFMMGQLGLFSGPIFAGALLQTFGRPGYLILPALSLVAFISGWQWLTHTQHPHPTPIEQAKTTAEDNKEQLAGSRLTQAIMLAIIILTSSTVSIAAISFAPKLFTEMGFEPGYVGLLSGLFMMGSAIGGVVGGTLADRIHGKWVIVLGMLTAVLPVYLYIGVDGLGRLPLLFLAGFFMGMPHSIIVIMVQSLLPRRRALASGIALGFMFFSGSIGSYVVGLAADQFGLAEVLQVTAVLPIVAALTAATLKTRS
ncbi:MAG: MFS transporter [Chloroflexi bacterium]|nr:MAG: MFS transporter [Chloroflexota bacterium]